MGIRWVFGRVCVSWSRIGRRIGTSNWLRLMQNREKARVEWILVVCVQPCSVDATLKLKNEERANDVNYAKYRNLLRWDY